MLEPVEQGAQDSGVTKLEDILIAKRTEPVREVVGNCSNLNAQFEASLKSQLRRLKNSANAQGNGKLDSSDVGLIKLEQGSSSRKLSMRKISAKKEISAVLAKDQLQRDQVLQEMWLTEENRQSSKRRRELCFMGVPVLLRGAIWSESLGNPLQINDELQRVLGERVKESEVSSLTDSHGDVTEGVTRMTSASNSIALDVPRTFTDLEFLHSGDLNSRDELSCLLEKYAIFRPEVGYVQGMSFIAAMFILHMDAYSAFRAFACILETTCLGDFYVMKMSQVRVYMNVHSTLLQAEIPDVYYHFKRHKVNPDLYMINWVMSLFSKTTPLELTCRLWDVLLLDGDVGIFRIALGLIKHIAKVFTRCNQDECLHLLTKYPMHENNDEVIASVRSVSLSKKKFKQVLSKCTSDMRKGEP